MYCLLFWFYPHPHFTLIRQSYDCPSASVTNLTNVDGCIIRIHDNWRYNHNKQTTTTRVHMLWDIMYPNFSVWASCQIRKIAGCACAGNAVNVSPPPRISDPDMHRGTCVTHEPWCMPGSLTSVFLWSRWLGKHCRRMRNPQFYVCGKRPIGGEKLHHIRHQLWFIVHGTHFTADGLQRSGASHTQCVLHRLHPGIRFQLCFTIEEGTIMCNVRIW